MGEGRLKSQVENAGKEGLGREREAEGSGPQLRLVHPLDWITHPVPRLQDNYEDHGICTITNWCLTVIDTIHSKTHLSLFSPTV